MHTSYGRKLADLAIHLAGSPRDAWPYLRHLPAWGRAPLDVGLPWFSFKAIRYLDAFLRPHHRVFEFGSGGSSLFFARRVASVTAMESHAGWHERVAAVGRTHGLANLNCELHPLDPLQTEDYRSHSFFTRVLSGEWDVIVVDCLCDFREGSYGELRRHALELSLPRVARGGLLVLDDSWLYPDLLQPRAGWEVVDLIGPGPCRYGVTSTAILRRTGEG